MQNVQFPGGRVGLGRVALVVAVVWGGPLFLRLPPWTDLTLYQTAATTCQTGGVLYRDVFDTNLPGFVGAILVIQSLFGPSVPVVRGVDLLMVAGIGGVLARWVRAARTGPGSAGGVVWFAAGVAWFYLFTSEFNHCQRDVWMLLPAAAAGLWRANRLTRPDGARFWAAMGEGLVWGVAVWIKPHAVVPAVCVWSVGVGFARRNWGGRGVGRDAAGVLLGGLLAGGIGLAALIAHGAWPAFWDVLTVWNPAYTAGTFAELPGRARLVLAYFPPWSYALIPAMLFALRDVWSARSSVSPHRALLGAMFLGWWLQAFVLQRDHDYIHVPEIILSLAILATRGWRPARLILVWLMLAGLVFALADRSPTVRAGIDSLPQEVYLPAGRPAAFDWRMVSVWPRCFGPASPELWDDLARWPRVAPSATWTELAAVENFLRTVHPPIRDRELLAFHDSPHPLYLRLGIQPATRFLHMGTACEIPGGAASVTAEVQAAPVRYVVSDLLRTAWRTEAAWEPGADGATLTLPAWLPGRYRAEFPWNQPLVFRAGRYCVHRVTHPIGEVTVPTWSELNPPFGPRLP